MCIRSRIVVKQSLYVLLLCVCSERGLGTRVRPSTRRRPHARARAERDDDDENDDDDDDGNDSEDSKRRRGTPRESRDDEVDDAGRGWTRKIYDDCVSTDGVEGARRGGVRG